MAIFAMTLNPGGIVAWLVVGLLAGWLAAKVMGGGGYGLLGDVVLGLIGALVGGFLFGLLRGGDDVGVGEAGFWASLAVAFLGACALLLGARYLGLGSRRWRS
jgi:uncharacterized membrane protein YeaQ/YmgE (transglycosylase-associated protein family)